MHAADVMTRNVITVSPESEVQEIASLLLEHAISAVPVVDTEDRVLGIVSEGDLIRRVDGGNGQERRRSWWLGLFTGHDAGEYVKSHGRRASEIMTRNTITVSEDTPLHRIAALLERHRIKRVPVVDDEGRLVGVVSRSNLLRGFSVEAPAASVTADDRDIRQAILEEIDENTGVLGDRLNIIVIDGRVQLWGLVDGEVEKMAVQVAAENTPGVKTVDNHLGLMPRGVGGV